MLSGIYRARGFNAAQVAAKNANLVPFDTDRAVEARVPVPSMISPFLMSKSSIALPRCWL